MSKRTYGSRSAGPDRTSETDPTEEGGVWVCFSHDWGPYLISVHAEEIEAHRANNGRGYGSVGFVPFGVEFGEAIKQWESPTDD